MRKILAFVLVVGLATVLSGCRIDGLWGYDDDTGTTLGTGTVVKATAVTLKALVPAGVTTSVRNSIVALTAADLGLKVTIGGVELDLVVDADGKPVLLNGNYQFEKTVTSATAGFTDIIANGGGNASLVITYQGVTYPAQSVVLTTTGATSVTLTVTLAKAIDTTTGNTTFTLTGGTGITVPTTPVATTTKQLLVAGVEYKKADGTTWATLNGASDVPMTNTTIRVTFNVAVNKATDSFLIRATSKSGTSADLTQANIPGLITATLGGSGKVLTMVLNQTQYGTKSLHAGQTYTLTFVNSTVERADDATVKLPANFVLANTFKMAQ